MVVASQGRRAPTAVGAFIFAGGFTLGVKQHFNVLCHLEGDSYGVATMRKNQPDVEVHVGSANWPGLVDLGASPDLVYGNPPCAAWSMAGKRGDSWKTDPRVDCTRLHFSLLEELRPKLGWVWESVPQAFTQGREFVDYLTGRALKLGYHVTYILHDAQWLGLPQRRRRFFFVAHRGDPPTAPPPLNWAPPTTAGEALREVTGRQRAVDTAEARHAWLLDEAAPGEELKRVFDRVRPGERGRGSGRPGFLVRRLDPDRVAPTFVGSAWFHHRQKRQLSMQELQQLCGFPLDYEFTPQSDAAKLSELARGVTPPVGAWLARWILNNTADRDPAPPTVTLLDVRKPPGYVEVIREQPL